MDEQGTSIAGRLEASRKDLLDLGLRNPLLNYRPSRSKGIEVVDELPPEVFRMLVREGKAMTFKAAPENPEGETASGSEDQRYSTYSAEEPGVSLSQPDASGPGASAERHLDLQLQTALASERLQSKLLGTERDARTFIEEQGVNVLFLALGMLRWYEAENSEEVRRAPLVLIPVSLDRSDAMQRFRLSYTGEELWENLSLKAKLRLEFGISLPDMPEHEDLSVEEYFDALEQAVAGQSGWSVDRSAISLGFFSFSKFLMYRDLDDERWPEDKKLTGHAVVGSLLGEGDLGSSEQIPDDEHVDQHLAPHETQQVVNADSSQALALLDVEKGCNLVVQGPPGTGKSQTITNVIAEAVGRGQTVLFVSEKMAALEVVKRRLDSTGFGDACLELHSRKTKKKTVLDELSRTLALGRPRVAEAEDDIQALHEARDELNAYSEAVNTEIDRSGLTPHQAMGELVRQGRSGAEAPRLSHGGLREWTRSEFRQAQTLVEGLQNKVAQIGDPRANPFYGTGREVLIPTDRPGVEERLHAAKESAERLRSASAALASVAGLSPPENRSGAESLLEAARKLRYAPDLSGMRPESSEWSANSKEISRLVERLERYAALRSEYEEALIPEAWQQDLLEVREHLAAYGGKLLRFISGDYREAHRKLAGLCASEPPKDAEQKLALVDAVLDAQRLEKEIEGEEDLGQSVFGSRWSRKYSDWRALKAAASFLIPLHEDVSAGRTPEEVLDGLRESLDEAALDREIPSLESALEEHASATESALAEIGLSDEESVRDCDLADQGSRFGKWAAELDRLEDMISYNRLARQFADAGLEGMVEIAETWSGAAHGLVDVLRYSFCEALIREALEQRPALASFDREGHEHTVERFRRLDSLLIEHNRARLAHAHWQQLPRHQAGGQLAVLKHEMQKKRRHLPLRRLMGKAGNAVQAIKPVFMMSPLSVANFLEPGALEFDLVVFDEASQVKPVEALGSIARGRQTVLVGDDKQLPPTSFFDTLMEADEGDEENLTGDLESVLGLFSSRGAPERMLRWHYRSRHESLITVSNHEFYENRLTVFPSPSANGGEVGLFYRHLPDTRYERGASRTNPEEARSVAASVMEHARSRPGLTLGVAAFSVSQAQAIQDQLEILRRNDPSCEEFFGAHPFEPFFVKNLENVQGDERDVIFISVGYGKDQNGRMAMAFGPLNKEGGERRLNVLITRARRRCEVFANFTADDLDLSRTGARGVRALKTFLRYAAGGDLEMPLSAGETESPFEDSVLAALRSEGYRVDTQVGSAGFFIDLAVVDPEQPGRYALGVECDGATYHSARSARDRDRLRQEVLEGLGWRIHRVWSTDWFKRPQGELERLVAAVEEARLRTDATDEGGATLPDEEPPLIRDPEEEETREDAASTPLYEMAEPDPLSYEIHLTPRGELARRVLQVTQVESPVHVDEVARRIAEAASVSRVGRRIREAVENACSNAVREGRVLRDGDFLWRKDMREPPIRDRSELPAPSRKHDLVAPEEIKAAVEKVVEDSFGIEKPEIPPAVLRLLGFGRTSEAARQAVMELIEEMVSDGSLTEENGHITR